MAITRREVLVVDDDLEIRHALRLVLEREGYTVHEAANGQQALDWLHTSPQRLVVLLDLQLPQVTGAQVVEQVAEQRVLTRHAYILITAYYGYTMSLDFAALVTQLSIPVITKPFDLDKLLAAVEAAARL
jgi:CheY-like chemotaxis protein